MLNQNFEGCDFHEVKIYFGLKLTDDRGIKLMCSNHRISIDLPPWNIYHVFQSFNLQCRFLFLNTSLKFKDFQARFFGLTITVKKNRRSTEIILISLWFSHFFFFRFRCGLLYSSSFSFGQSQLFFMNKTMHCRSSWHLCSFRISGVH